MVEGRTGRFSGISVDLHVGSIHHLQPENNPDEALSMAAFSKIQVGADGSVFDARNSHPWVKFRCKSHALDQIIFLLAYDHRSVDDLTPAQRKRLANIVRQLK